MLATFTHKNQPNHLEFMETDGLLIRTTHGNFNANQVGTHMIQVYDGNPTTIQTRTTYTFLQEAGSCLKENWFAYFVIKNYLF